MEPFWGLKPLGKAFWVALDGSWAVLAASGESLGEFLGGLECPGAFGTRFWVDFGDCWIGFWKSFLMIFAFFGSSFSNVVLDTVLESI